MKKYLVDTNILVNFLKSPQEMGVFFENSSNKIYLSYVVVAELVQGSLNKAELKKIKKFLGLFDVIWGGKRVEERAIALIEKYCLKYGLTLDDALIASTAIEHKMYLLTHNLKHFRFIKNLKLLVPSDILVSK